jgi:hypothetical protein
MSSHFNFKFFLIFSSSKSIGICNKKIKNPFTPTIIPDAHQRQNQVWYIVLTFYKYTDNSLKPVLVNYFGNFYKIRMNHKDFQLSTTFNLKKSDFCV